MRLFPILIALIFTHPALAEIYKWVDDSGKTHYGDKPQDDSAEVIRIEARPGLDPDHHSRTLKQRRLLDALDGERRENQQLKEQARAEKLKREINCAEARKNLTKITEAGYLYKKTTDPKNPLVYSNEERDKITRDAEKTVEAWCK